MENDTHVFIRLLLLLILMGCLVGIRLLFYGTVPFLGTLPGDITLTLPKGSIFLPIATSVLISLILTGIALLARFKSRD